MGSEPGRLDVQKLVLRVVSTEGWPSLGYCIENRLTVTTQIQKLLSHKGTPLAWSIGRSSLAASSLKLAQSSRQEAQDYL